ncbi:MAG TPA: hypothetical protein DIW47_15840 [Bacteroidetes bacterium]|nr:hypothetical protein [Bacteroidota bacterium]
MKHLTNGVYILLVLVLLFFSWLMLDITLPFFSFRYDIGFLLSKQHVLYLDIWRYSFYTHIASSLPLLLIGILQVIPPLRRNYPLLHRRLGRVYVFIVLFLAAPTGLIMGFYANGGIAAQASFMLLALCWWLFTFIGYRYYLKGELSKHGNFMIRSYALTLSAILLRSYVFVLPLFSSIHGKDMYILVAWMSWVPNLLLVELIFWLRKKRMATV